ncbi:type II and III secretion system protein family protein [Sphingopyxis sp. DHUNG17]|uniref:type II and III secretion system protein family protein n=1 Tax=Sphingopyxis jiangsuensis TaxID=2871171 RepID=UPI00191CF5B9|nr:type II and III secretion system protein family protein [Sphingopyxis lutea]MBL0769586.1 type II and III secretion system protein family protein [Sphingopyxis lutea]
MARNITRAARTLAAPLAAVLAPVLAPVLALSAAPAALAQYGTGGVHAGQLDVPLNKSQTVTLDRPFGRAMIGSEEIADILPISDRSIYVLGKKMGTTSLTVYDKGGRVITIVDVAVGPDVVTLRRQLGELMPGENISARISNEAVVLSGVVSSAAAAQNAVQIAGTYAGDKVVNMMGIGASQQVMLEVRFSEINRQSGKDIGVRSFFRNRSGSWDGALGDGASLVPDPDTGEGILKLPAITDSIGIVRHSFNIGGVSILGMLDSLESKGMAKTLAEPTLVALSGEKASFLAGGEFPIPVIQSSGGTGGADGTGQGITIEFKPFGVSLGFTPTILADGVINLVVEPEVSSIDPTASIVLNDITIPGLQTRRASTVLELRDGESFAIAGLIRQDFSTTVRQVPLLGSIPIIGSLFRSSGFKRGETELLIVVTPRLVQPIKPNQVALPTERVGDPTELDLFLLGRTDNAVPAIPPVQQQMPPKAAPPASSTAGDGYEY